MSEQGKRCRHFKRIYGRRAGEKHLISSHISSDLEHLCDDIYVIHKGKIVLHEEMDTILEKYAVLKVSEAQYQAVDKSYILKEKKRTLEFPA